MTVVESLRNLSKAEGEKIFKKCRAQKRFSERDIQYNGLYFNIVYIYSRMLFGKSRTRILMRPSLGIVSIHTVPAFLVAICGAILNYYLKK